MPLSELTVPRDGGLKCVAGVRDRRRKHLSGRIPQYGRNSRVFTMDAGGIKYKKKAPTIKQEGVKTSQKRVIHHFKGPRG